VTSSTPPLRYEIDPATVARETGGAVVAVSFGAARSFRLEGIAADVWALLARPGTAAEVADALRAVYPACPASLELDVTRFLDALAAAGLVLALEAAAPPGHEAAPSPAPPPPGAYAPPRLQPIEAPAEAVAPTDPPRPDADILRAA
jgi:hypothetical protein